MSFPQTLIRDSSFSSLGKTSNAFLSTTTELLRSDSSPRKNTYLTVSFMVARLKKLQRQVITSPCLILLHGGGVVPGTIDDLDA